MTWQPPIPHGALVEARALGAGLILLGHCYDNVHADGTITVNLYELSGLFGVSYVTVRRWWETMQDLGIIVDAQARGRGGVRGIFADEWIDWRLMESRSKSRSSMSDFPKSRSSMSALNGESRSKSRSLVINSEPAYKVLHDDQSQSLMSECEDQDGTARSLAHDAHALKLFFEFFPGQQLDAKQHERVCSTATDGTVWRSVLELFHDNGWAPLIGNLLDRYRKEATRKGSTNGHRNGARAKPIRPDTGPDHDRAELVPATSDDWKSG